MDCSTIINRYNALKSEHDSYWLTLWREAREYVQPNKVDYAVAGSKRGEKVYDPTAIDANMRLASGLYAWMSPPDKRWFELKPENQQLAKLDSVRWYFSEVNRLIYNALSNSNWSLMFHESMLNLGSIGTGVIYMEEGDTTALNFLACNIENICILEDKEQKVDTIFREFEYTARQCVQEFGYDACTAQQQAAYNGDQQEKKFKIIHCVMPRKDAKSRFGKVGNKDMPYASLWIDHQTKESLLESGYWENPYIVFRYVKNDNEQYGRSPAMNTIQEIKMLNRYRKADILGTEKVVEPPLLIPDNALLDNTFRTAPNAINYYRPSASGALPTAFFDGANLPQLEKKLEESRNMIRLAFCNDMFDALGDKRNMSATEIIERSESKLVPFAPVLGRMQCELYSPTIVRAFGIMARGNMLPPPPPELLANPSYKIEYVSRISMAVKQLEAKGLMQTIEMLNPLAVVKPEMLDHFDTDAITRGISNNNGLPSEWMKPMELVQKERAARQQAQAQQMAIIQATEAAKALPSAGKAPEAGSPLGAMMRGANGE
jgi:hypothetical protein